MDGSLVDSFILSAYSRVPAHPRWRLECEVVVRRSKGSSSVLLRSHPAFIT